MSKCKITGKVLSIQLGREETQIVLMGKGSEVLHSILVETPAGAVEDGMIRNVDAVRGMLKDALKTPEFRRVRQAVFTLCTTQIITETVTTPDLPDSRLEKLLQANVDMYFPVDMKDYQLVWQTIGPKSKSDLKELAVQLWAVPNQMLPKYYALGNGCGLSVLAVDYCGHSIATAVGASFAKSGKAAKAAKAQKKLSLNTEISFGKKKKETEEVEPAPVAVEDRRNADTDLHLSLEKDLLGMTFVQNGQVVYQRFIRCGSDPSYQLGELAMMVEYFRAMEYGRGSKLYGIASGALADNRELLRDISDVLGINVTLLDSGFDMKYALCVGAARTTLDFGNPALNKPGKARKDFQQQLWQYGLILAGGLALMAVVMLTLSSRIVWSSGIGRLESTKQNLTIQAQKTAGFADNYRQYASKYDAYSADWDTVFSSLRTYNDNLVLVLEELENTLPENTSVTGLQINPDGMNVQFACATKEEAAYLIMALRELQYADLLSISDLQGGGIGPATSYGSDEEEEEPPTEGSAYGGSALADLLDSDISESEMNSLSATLTMDEVKALNKAYTAKASTVNSNLDKLKANSTYDDAAYTQEREDAVSLRVMLTSNPYAAERFADMLINEDFDRGGEAILLGHIMVDLIKLQQSGKLDTEGDLMGSMNALVDILVKDETTLLKTEELLKTDKTMEAWYVYYLETDLKIQPARKLPYLDRDKMIADLMDGKFNSGNSGLDKKLGSVVSQSTCDLVASMNSADKMGKYMNDYLSKGTTGNKVADEMVADYLVSASSGCAPVDKNMTAAVSGGAIDAELGKLVEKYKDTGATGNPSVDKAIENYQKKGTTGNSSLDSVMNKVGADVEKPEDPTVPPATDPQPTVPPATDPQPTVPTPTAPPATDPIPTAPPATEPPVTEPKPTEPSKPGGVLGNLTEEDLKKMAIQYMVTGSTGNMMADVLLNSYKQNGTTGISAVDAKLEPYKDYITGDVGVDDLINQYLTTGTTGNDEMNAMIQSYLTTGTTGNKDMDEVLDAYISSGALDKVMEEMVDKYLTTGTTGNEDVDQMINNYLTKGTTGSDAIDDAIDGYVTKTSMSDKLLDLIKNSIKNSSTGNKVVDTMVKNYLTTGSTGNKLIDSMIKDAITGGRPDAPDLDIPGIGDKPLDEVIGNLTLNQVGQIIENFLIYGESGNDTLDDLLKDYFEAGTTDNKELDKLIEDFLNKGYASDELADLLLKYMANNSSGNSSIDKILKDYFETGSTGNPTLDDIFNAFLGDKAPGKNPKPDDDEEIEGTDDLLKKFLALSDEQVRSLAIQYYMTGSTGNKFYDTLMNRYKKFGTTGIADVDKKLEPHKQYILGQGGGTGDGSDQSGALGGGAGGKDTRIFFSAMLGYNSELINSELHRKGLNYGDKIDKLEVEE